MIKGQSFYMNSSCHLDLARYFLPHATGTMAGGVAEFGVKTGFLPLLLARRRPTACPWATGEGKIPRSDAHL